MSNSSHPDLTDLTIRSNHAKSSPDAKKAVAPGRDHPPGTSWKADDPEWTENLQLQIEPADVPSFSPQALERTRQAVARQAALISQSTNKDVPKTVCNSQSEAEMGISKARSLDAGAKNQDVQDTKPAMRFEQNPLKRYGHLLRYSVPSVLLLQGGIVLLWSIGAGILAQELPQLEQQDPLLLGYVSCGGMLFGMLSAFNGIHSAYYQMDELEKSTPYPLNSYLPLRMLICGFISLGCLYSCSCLLGANSSLKSSALFYAGACIFLAGTAWQLVSERNVKGMLAGYALLLGVVLLLDLYFSASLESFFQSKGLACTLLMAAANAGLLERRKRIANR